MAFSFAAGALVTSEQLSKFVFQVNDASTDASLTTYQIFAVELLVDAISAQIKKYVDSEIIAASFTEVWDGAGSDELVPRERPINSITSVKFSENNDFSSVSALDASSYTFDRWAIKFLGGLLTPVGRSLIQVVYNAGYSTIPKDITLAALLQFQWAYKQIGKGGAFVGVKQIGKMGESQTKDDTIGTLALRQEVCGLLNPYQRFECPLSIMFSRTS